MVELDEGVGEGHGFDAEVPEGGPAAGEDGWDAVPDVGVFEADAECCEGWAVV